MSVQPLTPPDPPPLLAVVSSIMDFPAPGIASPEDYARLVEQLGRLCPLQHFAMLGLADGGLHWLYEHQLPEAFKQQLGVKSPVSPNSSPGSMNTRDGACRRWSAVRCNGCWPAVPPNRPRP